MKKLPNNWTLARIADIILLTPKNTIADEVEAGFVPLQRLGTSFRARHSFEPRPWGDIKSGYTHFADGDVLLARITPSFENGKAGVARNLPNGIGAGSTEFFVCRPLEGVLLPEYLLAYFKTSEFIVQGKKVMSGAVGQQRVPKQYLLNSEIPLAPLEEQKRIVKKIDEVLEYVDSCQYRLSRLSKLVEDFRYSVLKAAVSGKLSEEWRGNIKAPSWNQEKAIDVCEKVQSGGTPKEGFADKLGIPFLKVYNIVNQKVNFDYKPQFVSIDIHEKELKKSQTLPGDVLMNIVGPPLGKVAIVPDNYSAWNVNQAITIFRPSKRITSKWLYYVLCFGENVREVMPDTKGSAGQINISLSQCRNFNLPVPPLEEQEEIVRRADSLFAYAEGIEQHITAASNKIKNIIPSLFAKAFNGELVPQVAEEESVDVMLEKAKALHLLQKELPSVKSPNKTKMVKPSVDSVKEVISAFPTEKFSFEDLQGRIFSDNISFKDYELLKEILFELLSEVKPTIKQVFEKELDNLQFVKAEQ